MSHVPCTKLTSQENSLDTLRSSKHILEKAWNSCETNTFMWTKEINKENVLKCSCFSSFFFKLAK